MYEAIVCKINNVRAHSNAQRVNLGTASGFQVVIGLDTKEGELGVFFPSDGKLSLEHCFYNNLFSHSDLNQDKTKKGYFCDKGRVRAQTFRGEISEGFWQPISCLAWAGENNLNDGDTFTEINGKLICEKYVSLKTHQQNSGVQNNVPKKKRPVVDYSALKEHYDTEQLRKVINKVPENAVCYLTLKMHGSSGRTMYAKINTSYKTRWQKFLARFGFLKTSEWKYISGSRRKILETSKNDLASKSDYRRVIHDMISNIGLRKGETLYYEIVGFTNKGGRIQGSHPIHDPKMQKIYGDHMYFNYGCHPLTNPFEIYVYRITMTSEDRSVVEYSYPQVVERCNKLGLKVVPLVYGPYIYKDKEELLSLCREHADGPDVVDPTHIREGVVVRIEHEKMFTGLKFKGFWFSNFEGNAKDLDTYVDVEDVE